jgi:hypothetical protein
VTLGFALLGRILEEPPLESPADLQQIPLEKKFELFPRNSKNHFLYRVEVSILAMLIN